MSAVPGLPHCDKCGTFAFIRLITYCWHNGAIQNTLTVCDKCDRKHGLPKKQVKRMGGSVTVMGVPK